MHLTNANKEPISLSASDKKQLICLLTTIFKNTYYSEIIKYILMSFGGDVLVKNKKKKSKKRVSAPFTYITALTIQDSKN